MYALDRFNTMLPVFLLCIFVFCLSVQLADEDNTVSMLELHCAGFPLEDFRRDNALTVLVRLVVGLFVTFTFACYVALSIYSLAPPVPPGTVYGRFGEGFYPLQNAGFHIQQGLTRALRHDLIFGLSQRLDVFK